VVCLTADRRRQAASVHFALLTRENRSVADVSIGVVISSATTTPQRVQFPIVTSSIDFCRLPPLCAPLSCPVIVVIVRNPLSRVDRHALQRTRSWILVILNLITVLGCSWSSSWHYFLGDRTAHTGCACWLLYFNTYRLTCVYTYTIFRKKLLQYICFFNISSQHLDRFFTFSQHNITE